MRFRSIAKQEEEKLTCEMQCFPLFHVIESDNYIGSH